MVPAKIANAKNQFKLCIKLPMPMVYAYIMPSQIISRDWKIILFLNVNYSLKLL